MPRGEGMPRPESLDVSMERLEAKQVFENARKDLEDRFAPAKKYIADLNNAMRGSIKDVQFGQAIDIKKLHEYKALQPIVEKMHSNDPAQENLAAREYLGIERDRLLEKIQNINKGIGEMQNELNALREADMRKVRIMRSPGSLRQEDTPTMQNLNNGIREGMNTIETTKQQLQEKQRQIDLLT